MLASSRPRTLMCWPYGLLALVIGCTGTETPTQPDRVTLGEPGAVATTSEDLVQPELSRLTSIGCTALGDSAIVGAIGVPVSPNRLERFDCRGVPRDSVARTVVSLLSNAASANGHATMMEFGTWELINFWQDCTTEGGTGEGSYEDGVWVLPDIGVSCTTWYVYQWVPDPGGNGTPPDSPPDEPPGGGGGGDGHHGEDDPPNVDSLPLVEQHSFEPDDLLQPTDTINCSLLQENQTVTLYCNAPQLREGPSSYGSRLQSAISRMRSLGGICGDFADALDSVNVRNAIRYSPTFPHSAWSTKGLGGMGGVLVRELYFSNYFDSDHQGMIASGPDSQQVTLQLILAHEAEHLIDGSASHIDPLATLMTHTLECSDLREN